MGNDCGEKLCIQSCGQTAAETWLLLTVYGNSPSSYPTVSSPTAYDVRFSYNTCVTDDDDRRQTTNDKSCRRVDPTVDQKNLTGTSTDCMWSTSVVWITILCFGLSTDVHVRTTTRTCLWLRPNIFQLGFQHSVEVVEVCNELGVIIATWLERRYRTVDLPMYHQSHVRLQQILFLRVLQQILLPPPRHETTTMRQPQQKAQLLLG